jgi:hypothetical protein
MSTSFFMSRRALKPASHSGMPRWQDLMFIRLRRSANDATDYFQIPTGRVMEVGTQVTIQGQPHALAAPIVSATLASRAPRGFLPPSVESSAV